MSCKLCQEEQEDLFRRSGGSCGQIICCHDVDNDDSDTDAPDVGGSEDNEITDDFPMADEFKSAYGDGEETSLPSIPFRDLPINEVYQIMEIKRFTTATGDAMILCLKNKKHELTDVWATPLVRQRFNNVVIDNTKNKLFIISEGSTIAKRSKHPFYKFKTLVKKTL